MLSFIVLLIYGIEKFIINIFNTDDKETEVLI